MILTVNNLNLLPPPVLGVIKISKLSTDAGTNSSKSPYIGFLLLIFLINENEIPDSNTWQ